MALELDDWDREWLSRSHSADVYRAKVKELMERCAAYAEDLHACRLELDQLRRTARTGCAYPNCLDGGGRCAAMFKGECAGPQTDKRVSV